MRISKILCLSVVCVLMAVFLAAQSSGPIEVSEPSVPVLTPAVRDLPQCKEIPSEYTREAKRRDEHGVVPNIQSDTWLFEENPLVTLQKSVTSSSMREVRAFSTPIQNFDAYLSASSPPDDTGDVGPNHFVQGCNSSGASIFRVYSKTGTNLGTWYMEDLGTGTCTSGYCDPIILYDQLADRWVISEFNSTARNLCVLVSTSPDPTGTYYAYEFITSVMQDYPKYGVWHDGYYVAANNGGTIRVLEREAMLQGLPATVQSFSIGTLSGFSFQLTMPAGAEGWTPPPADEPAIFLRPCDAEIHTNCTSDVMEMWELDVDWNTPANSTLTKLPNVGMSSWDHTLCGTSGNWDCMPQPGTSQMIDPIREPIHFPLQYRNFETHETLVGCFVEDVNSTDQAAVHWFEIRREGGGWFLEQDGVIGGGDAQHRAVCSAAMDQSGNIAVGYTRTGANAPYYPSVYYSGRLSSDPPGTMPYFDYVIRDATTSKTNNERWGDYSGIGVDPEDDCTFWYTTEYGGSGQTRIAAVKFDACGCLEFPPKPVITATAIQPDQIDISWSDSTLATVIEYKLYRSTTPGGPYALIDTIADTSPGVGGSGSYLYNDTPLPSGTTYYYVLEASDGLACISELSDEKSATLFGTNVVFDSYSALTEITGNGNGQFDQGEKWSVEVTLRNDGNQTASNVTAVLQADGITLCNSPGTFGTINQGGADLESYVFEFVIDSDFSSVYGCPADLSFDVVTKTSNEQTPAGVDEPDMFSDTVASGGMTLADEAGQTGTILGKNTTLFNTVNHPVTSTPGVINACTVDISMDPPGYSSQSLVVSVEHDPGQDGTYEYTQTVYSGTVTGWSNITGYNLSNMIDGSDIGNGYWRVRVVNSGSGPTGNGTMQSWTVHLTSGNWDCSYVGSGSCSGCSMTVDVTPDGTTSTCAGNSILFTATPSGGSGPYTYQWTEDGSAMAGETDNTLNVGYGTAQSHTYNCRVSDSGSCSNITDSISSTGDWVASLSVNVTPDGTTLTCGGNDIVFTASPAGGLGPYSYQWYEDGGMIVGATNATYTANYGTAQSHTYNCEVSGSGDCSPVQDASSSTGEWSDPLAVDVTPDGTTSACAGNDIVFTATPAGGTGPYSYQWYEDGGMIAGATNATYTANYGTAQSHTYNCEVNGSGDCPPVQDASSSTGEWFDPLTVDVTPDGTTIVDVGMDILFTATPAGGDGSYTYQWTEDGGAIAGATNATYTANYATAQSHTYNCELEDGFSCGPVTDPAASTGEWIVSSIPPPPSADGTTGAGMSLTKVTGDTLHVVFDIATCSADHAVMLYGILGNFSAYTGAVDAGCNVGAAGSADFDIAADNVWFNLVWANSSDDGGHPGFSTSGDRTLNATGYCSVTADDHSDTICD